MISLLLQVPADSLSMATGVEAPSILSLLLKGGLVFIIPLLAMSVVAVYIFFERFFKIQAASKVDQDFMEQIQDFMLNGNIDAANKLCSEQDTPIARMVHKGIQRIGKPLRNIEVAIENEGKIQLLELENNLATLATISGAAPMLGFLGTVTGMIDAFWQISNAGSNVDPGLLAGGIYQALVTTAAGLTIGIIAYIGYNVLVAMVEKVIYKMELTSVEFVDFLQKPVK